MSLLSLSPSRRRLLAWLKKEKHRRQALHPALRLEVLEERTLLDAGTWTQLTNAAPAGIGTMMLLTDGTVMAEGPGETNAWYKLTPSATGSYAGGTWSTLASMHNTRLYFASDVTQSGNVFVVGGEYSSAGSDTRSAETYNPVTNTWTVDKRFPKTEFGDDPSMLLNNGLILTGYITGPQTYFYNPTSSTIVDNGISVPAGGWKLAATKQGTDWSDEEGFVKMPNGDILSYDVGVGGSPTTSSAQYYNPSTNKWTATSNLSAFLTDNTNYELGPGLLLPDGDPYYVGGGTVSGASKTYTASGSANTAFYNPSTNAWTLGPVVPNHQASDDGPGAMLPTGQVLFASDTEAFTAPSTLYLYSSTGNTISAVTSEPAALSSALSTEPSYVERMLMLPTGQVLFTDSTSALWVYTPSGTTNTNVPKISSITGSGLGPYTLTGTQLNGQSAGATYGDDAQMDSNYPIVYLKSSGGNVYFARTTNWSTTGVQTGSTSETVTFNLPSGIPAGSYSLYVSGAGLSSVAFSFTAPRAISPDALGAFGNRTLPTVTESGSGHSLTVAPATALAGGPASGRHSISSDAPLGAFHHSTQSEGDLASLDAMFAGRWQEGW